MCVCGRSLQCKCIVTVRGKLTCSADKNKCNNKWVHFIKYDETYKAVIVGLEEKDDTWACAVTGKCWCFNS